MNVYIILYSWNGEFPTPSSWIKTDDGYFDRKEDAEKYLFDKGYYFNEELKEYRYIEPVDYNAEWSWAEIVELGKSRKSM